MAEIEQNNYTQVENPGAYYPQDYSLENINFLTGSGQRFELKKIFTEISYFEDIYSFAVSGYVTIVDAQGFIELLQLTGNEFVEIIFAKTKNAPNINKQVFRVYKIGDRKPIGNLNSESYTFYFCSEELILSEQTKISKSYKGKEIYKIIRDIMTDKLAVDPKKLYIERTTGINDFIVPQLKPFEAISWLSTYARPDLPGIKGADMLFFETKDRFNFRSLQSMFQDEIYTTYKYQQKNIADEKFQEKTVSVLDYEFVKVYDMMDNINSGAFANRLISIDPLARSSKITDFNYLKYKAEAKTLNQGDPSNIMKNRLGLTNVDSYNASFKVATGNAFQQDQPYIKQAVGGIAKNIAIETYVPNRTAQISLANYTVLKIKIPGDTGITAGRTINFNLLSLKPTGAMAPKKNLDELYSGKYLVTAIRHIIQPTAFQTVLEIAKDSTPTKYASISNNSSEWRNIIKS